MSEILPGTSFGTAAFADVIQGFKGSRVQGFKEKAYITGRDNCTNFNILFYYL
jgi:hypothetical protein